MNQAKLPVCTSVDVVFPLVGQFLLREHAPMLKQALCQVWPWLQTEPHAAVQSIKLVTGNEAVTVLSRRAKLMLRLGRGRAQELLTFAGVSLDLGGHALQVQTPHLHELVPHTTVYAYRVAAPAADEAGFMQDVADQLAGLGVAAERICGKRQPFLLGSQSITTFSLMLHGLPPAASLLVQQHGLGAHRLLGCGIFVPHKSAAAV